MISRTRILNYHSVADRRAAYLAGTSRSVGRGWRFSHLLPRIFIEIGTDADHVHFLAQTVPSLSGSRVSQIVKRITAREIFKRIPEVKKELWGGEFWTKGYWLNTVGRHGNEDHIRNYVKEQGREKEYVQLHREQQLSLFDTP